MSASGAMAAVLALLLHSLVPVSAHKVIELDEISFDAEVSGGNTFVMFYAPWCGHCKRLEPTWDSLSEKLSKVKLAKVDSTQHKWLTRRYSIRGFPTLLFFGENDKIYRYQGERSLTALTSFAQHGWKRYPQYDPKAPPPKRQSQGGFFAFFEEANDLRNRAPFAFYFLTGVVGVLVVAFTLVCYSLYQYDSTEDERELEAERRRSREADFADARRRALETRAKEPPLAAPQQAAAAKKDD